MKNNKDKDENKNKSGKRLDYKKMPKVSGGKNVSAEDKAPELVEIEDVPNRYYIPIPTFGVDYGNPDPRTDQPKISGYNKQTYNNLKF